MRSTRAKAEAGTEQSLRKGGGYDGKVALAVE
jgi:hypothetical protein